MIRLDKILAHLPAEKIEELETITNRIADTGKAEIVILFGSYARGSFREKRGQDSGKKSDYDILVITEEYDTKKQLGLALSGAFSDLAVPVQLLIETIGFVNSNLEEKQYFFTDIKREGKILYNTGKHQLSDSLKLTPDRRREIAEEDFKTWFGEANNCWKDYQMCEENKMYKRSSFHLQQAVEMCYTAIEMVYSHYNPHEHNLEVLRNRVLEFDNRTKNAFPCETDQQKELFDYLNFAYIGGRYRSEEEFPVTGEQLKYWSEEAQKLLKITETICNQRIESLKEIEREWGE